MPGTLHLNRKLLIYCIVSLSLIATFTLFSLNIKSSTDTKQQDSQNHIPVLMYHSINDTPIGITNLSVITKSFDQQMQYLDENGYTPIYINEINKCPQYKKPIIITFDDGYVDNFTFAYPILKKYNIKATIFVITKLIDVHGYITKDEISAMEDLVSFQSHTVDHLKLDGLSPDKVKYECSVSKNTLSEITKKPVYAIAYPNGKFNAGVLNIVSKYYDYGISTMQGLYNINGDRYKIRRIAISRSDTLTGFILKLN